MGWFWADLLIFFPHTIAFGLAATTGGRVLVPRCTTEVRVAWVYQGMGVEPKFPELLKAKDIA